MSDAAAGRLGKAAVSPGSPMSLPPSSGSPSEQSWQERDSGLGPQPAAERVGEEITLVLLSLMEHYRASVGLTPTTDVTTGAVGRPSVVLGVFCFFKGTFLATVDFCLRKSKAAPSVSYSLLKEISTY